MGGMSEATETLHPLCNPSTSTIVEVAACAPLALTFLNSFFSSFVKID